MLEWRCKLFRFGNILLLLFVVCHSFLHIVMFFLWTQCAASLPVAAVLLSVLQHGLAARDIEELLEVGCILPSHGSIVAFTGCFFLNLFDWILVL